MPLKATAFTLLALAAPLLLATTPARAAADDKKDASKTAADKDKKDDAKADKDDKAKAEDPNDPSEDPNKTYRFIGLRYRDAIVPKFIINWFADGGRNVNVPMVGPEFISRRDHLEFAVSIMYADYSMNAFLFKGKGDGDAAYELVNSGLKLVYATFDILYEIPIEKKSDRTGRFAFLIGGGVGLAGVFGPLYRTQAYPSTPNASPNNASQWTPCKSATDGPSDYCSNPSNNHYWPTGKPDGSRGAYAEPSWAGGGSKPMVFPWLALPQVGFRFKPIKHFQMKVDGGFSTSGFFFGASASYGL